MPSPFPGMDPYLEDPAVWEEFHHVFIPECMYFLSDRLPDAYVAKVGERVELIGSNDEAAGQYIPATAIAPVTIPSVESVEVREGYVEILRLPDYDLVTSIELLSPWNRYGKGIGEYRHKRRSLVRSGVHVVEIDLLRRGERTELARPLPAGQYYAFVFRGDRRPDVDVFAWSLRDALPTITVPLRAPDSDVPMELSTVVSTAYDRSRYVRKLRYAGEPPAPSLDAA